MWIHAAVRFLCMPSLVHFCRPWCVVFDCNICRESSKNQSTSSGVCDRYHLRTGASDGEASVWPSIERSEATSKGGVERKRIGMFADNFFLHFCYRLLT